jgi:hypothetical protein
MYVTLIVPSISLSFSCYYCVQTFLISYPNPFYAQSLDRQTQWMLICLETKKIIKSRDVVFMGHSGSISNVLEMCSSGRIEGPTAMVVVDESSKSHLFDAGGQFDNEQKEGNVVAIGEAHEGLTNNDIIVEGFSEERQIFGEWLKNHILP